jgi:hypothetical protein
MTTGEQNQKKRTYDVLPKPGNSIRCRQDLFAEKENAIKVKGGIGLSAQH